MPSSFGVPTTGRLSFIDILFSDTNWLVITLQGPGLVF